MSRDADGHAARLCGPALQRHQRRAAGTGRAAHLGRPEPAESEATASEPVEGQPAWNDGAFTVEARPVEILETESGNYIAI